MTELTRLVEATHSDLPEDTLETLELIRLEGEKGSLMLEWLDALRPFVRLDGPLSKERLGLGLTRAAIWCQRAGCLLENAGERVSIVCKRSGSKLRAEA